MPACSTLSFWLVNAGREGFSRDSWSNGVLTGLFNLGFAVLLGSWISKIIDESKQRGELILQLHATRADLAAAGRARGVLTERARMAREIHDTLDQGFTSIAMQAAARAGRADALRHLA